MLDKNIEKPMISVVLPSIRKNNLNKFLSCIRSQTYPQDKLEIVIAWGSHEDISELAQKYNCRVIVNCTNDMEERRRVAIENAAGEWIFMADDDNYFPNTRLIENMMGAVLQEKSNAVECVWQHYDRNDPMINRYCALIGAYDPAVFYLKRQDHLRNIDKKWVLKGQLLNETSQYFKVKFTENEIPTMGDQGFLIRKNDMMLGFNGKVIMHMDVCAELVKQGRNDFIFMKDYFGHDCVTTKKQLINKLRRNVDRFQVDGKQRTMNYSMNSTTMIKLGLILGTFIIPLKDAIVGFIGIHDVAWFIHPILCFQVAVVYTKSTIFGKLRKKKK